MVTHCMCIVCSLQAFSPSSTNVGLIRLLISLLQHRNWNQFTYRLTHSQSPSVHSAVSASYRLAASHSFVSVHSFFIGSGTAFPLFLMPSYTASHSPKAVLRSPSKSIDWGKYRVDAVSRTRAFVCGDVGSASLLRSSSR